MEALVVKIKNKKDKAFAKELLYKLGLEVKAYNEEELEDLGLAYAMKKANRKKVVSREVIMEKLKKE